MIFVDKKLIKRKLQIPAIKITIIKEQQIAQHNYKIGQCCKLSYLFIKASTTIRYKITEDDGSLMKVKMLCPSAS